MKPPTFDHADNPIEADDWLRGIKRRLELVKCTDKEGLMSHPKISDFGLCIENTK